MKSERALQDEFWKSISEEMQKDARAQYEKLIIEHRNLCDEDPPRYVEDIIKKINLFQAYFGKHNLDPGIKDSGIDRLHIVGKEIVYVPYSVLSSIGHSTVPIAKIVSVKVERMTTLDGVNAYMLSDGNIVPACEMEKLLDKPFLGLSDNVFDPAYYRTMTKAYNSLLAYCRKTSGDLHTVIGMMNHKYKYLEIATSEFLTCLEVWKRKESPNLN